MTDLRIVSSSDAVQVDCVLNGKVAGQEPTKTCRTEGEFLQETISASGDRLRDTNVEDRAALHD